MANTETMKNAKKLVERSMIGNDGSHDSWHVWRVRDLALSLAREEGLSSNPDSMEKVQSQRGLVHGKFGKDPTVETSFSSDSEREAEEEAEGERLRKQWQHVQEHIRSEPLQITYNCWDGARHRRVIQVHKGDRIGEFLRAVQQQLAPEFRKVRSGPLFHFDVHEDVQTIADATIKKDESHAGKVVERHWYEKNKHIFPASR